jgi:DNA repair protein RecO
MPRYHERALVLDVTAYRESSSLVRVLTEHEGRVSLVARGLRSSKTNPAAAALQPFNIVKLQFSLKDGATLGNLISADIEQMASAPHRSVEAYALVSYWFEILKETSEERASMAGVFDLTTQMLHDQHAMPGLDLLFLQALTSLCRQLGFGITWDACVVCDRPKPPHTRASYFSIARGGLVCTTCAQTHAVPVFHLTPDEGKAIELLSGNAPPTQAPAASTPELLPALTLINRYLINHLEHPLHTFRFVTEISKDIGRPGQP